MSYYNPYENNPYQRSATQPPVEVRVAKETNKGMIIAAWITGAFVILAAVITGIFGLVHLTTPTSSPSSATVTSISSSSVATVTPTAVVAAFPSLHGNYSGSFTRNGVLLTLNMEDLTENAADGSFQASGGNAGYCYATYSGNVQQDGTITISVHQLTGGPNICPALVFVLSGTVGNDGSNPHGTWDYGTWNLE
jgi:hypothetical protein